ncbi:hypothetical protein HYS47_04225 [Candidatus Woesearchaeota archaeon]|nr:hypothetical protein [Candidatus Woesearchaeota archaeon]
MKLTATLLVEGNPDLIMAVLAPVFRDRQDRRAVVRAEQQKEGVALSIIAKDVIAFRASMNSITQLLAVQEKTSQIK